MTLQLQKFSEKGSQKNCKIFLPNTLQIGMSIRLTSCSQWHYHERRRWQYYQELISLQPSGGWSSV